MRAASEYSRKGSVSLAPTSAVLILVPVLVFVVVFDFVLDLVPVLRLRPASVVLRMEDGGWRTGNEDNDEDMVQDEVKDNDEDEDEDDGYGPRPVNGMRHTGACQGP